MFIAWYDLLCQEMGKTHVSTLHSPGIRDSATQDVHCLFDVLTALLKVDCVCLPRPKDGTGIVLLPLEPSSVG